MSNKKYFGLLIFIGLLFFINLTIHANPPLDVKKEVMFDGIFANTADLKEIKRDLTALRVDMDTLYHKISI